MQEVKTLLNSLIQRGLKPCGKERCLSIEIIDNKTFEVNCGNIGYRCSLRELVSLESGLWQFVCDNKLVKQTSKERALNPTYGSEGADCDWCIQSNEEQYRLLESALVPEEELGQFLVDNIKVGGKGN